MNDVSSMPAGLRVREWYEGDRYLKAHPTWFIHEAPWKARQVLRMCVRNNLQPHHIVDVGCGAGGVLAELQSLLPAECQLDGYDIAPAAITMANELENDRLRFSVADVAATPDIRADLILVLDVIDHIEDVFGFLRALKPKGRYKIFHFSLNLSVQKVVRRNGLLARREQGEIHYYSKETALELLRDTGYEIKDYFYTNMSLDLNDARGRLLDAATDRPAIHWRNFLLRFPRRAFFRFNPDLTVRVLGGFHFMVLAE